jgi:hypothetical protein
MTQKIEEWNTFEQILASSVRLGETMSGLVRGMGVHERLALAQKLVDASIDSEDDEQTVGMTELYWRALQERNVKECSVERKGNAVAEFRDYLERVFLRLPMRIWNMPKTVLFIVDRCINDWEPEPAAASMHSFRRLIAIGWPVFDEKEPRRDGESNIELRVRGRVTGAHLQKSILNIVRRRLTSWFHSDFARQYGPDATFGPWLAMSNIPDDLRDTIVMARAKAGGHNMALQDIRNRELLNGVPESGRQIIDRILMPMRRAVIEYDELLERLFKHLGELNPGYNAREYLHRDMCFDSPGAMTIAFDCSDPEVMLPHVSTVVREVRADGKLLNMRVQVVIRERGSRSVSKVWAKKRK